MTTTLTIARCPQCGNVETVFVRSDDGSDLVCREDLVSSTNPTVEDPFGSSRQSLREGVRHPHGSATSPAPSRKSYRRIP